MALEREGMHAPTGSGGEREESISQEVHRVGPLIVDGSGFEQQVLKATLSRHRQAEAAAQKCLLAAPGFIDHGE